MSDDTRISEIKARHRPVSVQTGSPWVGICVTCDDPMPCDAATLAAVHEQQAARIASLEQERDHARLELLNQEEAARVRTNLQIATFKRLVEQGMQAFRRIVDARTARQEGGDE